MDDKVRCQSCGMPLKMERDGKVIEGMYGTNADGSENREWCKFCFASGAFTAPQMTVDQMVQRSVDFMTRNLGFPEDAARAQSHAVIPNLRRWSKR